MTDAERARFATLKQQRDNARCPTIWIYTQYTIYKLSAAIKEKERR